MNRNDAGQTGGGHQEALQQEHFRLAQQPSLDQGLEKEFHDIGGVDAQPQDPPGRCARQIGWRHAHANVDAVQQAMLVKDVLPLFDAVQQHFLARLFVERGPFPVGTKAVDRKTPPKQPWSRDQEQCHQSMELARQRVRRHKVQVERLSETEALVEGVFNHFGMGDNGFFVESSGLSNSVLHTSMGKVVCGRQGCAESETAHDDIVQQRVAEIG